MKKKIVFLIFMIGVVVCLSGCGKETQKIYNIEIKVKDMGSIKVELDAEEAPITVKNFVKLVQDEFYDGLTFHRVVENFMIQGGDPEGNGFGGLDKKIKGEFKENGVENNISHRRGTISMARSKDPDSASCQFFIVHKDSIFLDGKYAAFGHVTEGMEIVDEIAENTPVEDEESGYVNKDNQPVIESIRLIEE